MAADRRLREKLEGAFSAYLSGLVSGSELEGVAFVEGRVVTEAEVMPCVVVCVEGLRADPVGSGCYEFDLKVEARIHSDEPEDGGDPEALNSERVGLLADWLADQEEALGSVNAGANELHVQGYEAVEVQALIADPVLMDRVVIRGHAVPWELVLDGYAFGSAFSSAFKIAS